LYYKIQQNRLSVLLPRPESSYWSGENLTWE